MNGLPGAWPRANGWIDVGAMMRNAIVLAALSLAACQAPEKQESEIGRFTITAIPGTSQAVLLDTTTGETWHRVSTGASDVDDVTEWLPMNKTTLEKWSSLNRQVAQANAPAP